MVSIHPFVLSTSRRVRLPQRREQLLPNNVDYAVVRRGAGSQDPTHGSQAQGERPAARGRGVRETARRSLYSGEGVARLSIHSLSRRSGSVFALLLLAAIALAVPWARAESVDYTAESFPSNASIIVIPGFAGTNEGLGAMALLFMNLTEASVAIVWDESALVLVSGRSLRLVQEGTPVLFIGQPQAPTPVAPLSQIVKGVWPEAFIKEGKAIAIPWSLSGRLRLHLVWTENGARQSGEWIWRLQEIMPPPPTLSIPWWVWTLVGLALLGLLLGLSGN